MKWTIMSNKKKSKAVFLLLLCDKYTLKTLFYFKFSRLRVAI